MKILSKSIQIIYFIAFIWTLIDACANPYTVVAGDTCEKLATSHGISLDQLLKLNPGKKCGPNLEIGDTLCFN
jgi:hypothetical protein